MDMQFYFEDEDSKKLNNIATQEEGHNISFDLLDPTLETSFDLRAVFPELVLPETSPDLSGAEELAVSTSQMPVVQIPAELQLTADTADFSEVKHEEGETVPEVPLDGAYAPSDYAASESDFNTITLSDVTSSTEARNVTASPSGRRPAPGKAQSAGKGRKRALNKDSEEYRARRDRNNVAVRKSRDKAKVKQVETEQRVRALTDENDRLNKRCDLLEKELNVLKGLFATMRATPPAGLPKQYKDMVARQ